MGNSFIGRLIAGIFGLSSQQGEVSRNIKPPAKTSQSDGSHRIESRAERRQEVVHDLNVGDGAHVPPKAPMVEKRIARRAEPDPASPLLGDAATALESGNDRRKEEFAPLPALRELGEIGDVCPSCRVVLLKRPGRKTMCKSCGQAIFVRKRPLDDQRVLVNEAGVAEIEKDWLVQYKASQRNPRPVSEEWQQRIAEAAAAGPDPDPEVERLAQKLFADVCAACLSEAPRDAKDRLLAGIADQALRARVDRRAWQLQVQNMGG